MPDPTPTSPPLRDLAFASPEVDARLTELEVKVSYADDLLDALNAIVAQQQQQIDRLMREVQQLRQQSADGPVAPRNLRDELPPHY
ncbi:MAG: SlyX family protein [Burkholderiales bacterium]|nr:SlyX family protein [Burkholderiales bacterium]